MSEKKEDERLSRLRWKCRRGLLELDLILNSFLNRKYNSLSEEDLEQFSCLLEESDTKLLGYMQGTAEPEQKELKLIIQKIL